MRLSQKQEQGLEAACDILGDMAKWGYSEEQKRLDLAIDTLLEILERSREQKAKERSKRALKGRLTSDKRGT